MANGQSAAHAGSQWTAEVALTPQFAADLIREQFPDLGAGPVTALATGWDNAAFVVGGQWLFRFPRREVAVPGVRREITVLPRLAAILPLPIPDSAVRRPAVVALPLAILRGQTAARGRTCRVRPVRL